MSDDVALPLQFTEAAANKVKSLIADEDNPNLKLRVYITGGGCSGFQYGVDGVSAHAVNCWQSEVVFFSYLEHFLYVITSDNARFYEIKNFRHVA
mgnify:CR=1 FL=1